MIKVEYIDHMGDDLRVANAARVSFAKWKGKQDAADARLIDYLADHGHWTPFAHTAVTLRVRAPLPMRTHCFKHKEGFVENEESRRYIQVTPEVFFPAMWRKAPTNGAKQGSVEMPVDRNEYVDNLYREAVEFSLVRYEKMLADGVCPEQARFVLPQGSMVNWIWTGNLASYSRFFSLRTDPHTQKETRDIAHAVGDVIMTLFPVSWAALTGGDA